MEQGVIALAQAVAALGAVGILSLIFILWVGDVLHTKKELDRIKVQYDEERAEHAKQDTERNEEWNGALAYRERLRLEAIDDRKQSDQRLADLTKAIQEGAGLTQRTLDLNEALFDELTQREREQNRSPTTRTRRGDRGRGTG